MPRSPSLQSHHVFALVVKRGCTRLHTHFLSISDHPSSSTSTVMVDNSHHSLLHVPKCVIASRKKKYPYWKKKNSVIGTVHRVSFLPQRFMLPAGSVITKVWNSDDQLVDMIRHFPRQEIFLKTPDVEVFVPDSSVYEGPIVVPQPETCEAVIKCHPDSEMFWLRSTENGVIPTPSKTILRFWPPALPKQFIPEEWKKIAYSRHAVRGELNGDHRHLLKDYNVIMTLEQRRNRFPKDCVDLRIVILKRNAAKIPRPHAYNTRYSMFRLTKGMLNLSLGSDGEEETLTELSFSPKRRNRKKLSITSVANPIDHPSETSSENKEVGNTTNDKEILITDISEVCIDFTALDIQDSKDEKFENIPLGTESEKKSNKESKNENEEVRVSIGDLSSPPELVKEKFVRRLKRSCSLL